jgi:NADPH:quinone reductase-like Zn-dependent oxidoreductase
MQMDEAATVTLPYAAAYAVLGLAHLRCGDAILVQGADSPLGLACIRIAMCHGLKVLSCPSSGCAKWRGNCAD